MRKELISWQEVDRLIDHLIPQFTTEFDAILMLSKSGIIPGGLLAEALGIDDLMLVRIDFPKEFEMETQRQQPLFVAWPSIRNFPTNDQLVSRKILIVSNAWGTGRCQTSIRDRIGGAGGKPFTCVLHYNPHSNLFKNDVPDFYAAITNAWIIYPWEAANGKDPILADIS